MLLSSAIKSHLKDTEKNKRRSSAQFFIKNKTKYKYNKWKEIKIENRKNIRNSYL